MHIFNWDCQVLGFYLRNASLVKLETWLNYIYTQEDQDFYCSAAIIRTHKSKNNRTKNLIGHEQLLEPIKAKITGPKLLLLTSKY